MKRRLASWKKEYLAKRGRLILINNTISSPPFYFVALLVIPKLGKIGWKKVVVIGYKKVFHLNTTLLGNWVWRFTIEQDSLLRKIIKGRFGELDEVW